MLIAVKRCVVVAVNDVRDVVAGGCGPNDR